MTVPMGKPLKDRLDAIRGRVALAECTEAEIATITGHSLRDVSSILDAQYLNRDKVTFDFLCFPVASDRGCHLCALALG